MKSHPKRVGMKNKRERGAIEKKMGSSQRQYIVRVLPCHKIVARRMLRNLAKANEDTLSDAQYFSFSEIKEPIAF